MTHQQQNHYSLAVVGERLVHAAYSGTASHVRDANVPDEWHATPSSGLVDQPYVLYGNRMHEVCAVGEANVTLARCYGSAAGTPFTVAVPDAKLGWASQKAWPSRSRRPPDPNRSSDDNKEASSNTMKAGGFLGAVGAIGGIAAAAVRGLGSRYSGAAAVTHGLRMASGGIGMTAGIGVVAGLAAVAGAGAWWATNRACGTPATGASDSERGKRSKVNVPLATASPVTGTNETKEIGYVLDCEGGNVYVGKTVDLPARFQAHRDGTGSAWTATHHAVDIRRTFPISSRLSEDEAVFEEIARLGEVEGLARVRGGTYTMVHPSDADVEHVRRYYRHAYGLCLGCGGMGHAAKQCPRRNSSGS